MNHNLYRHFDASGALLYVGISLSAVQRLGQHRHNSHWFESIARIEIETFMSRAQVLIAERSAIEAERPLHNIALNEGNVIPLQKQRLRTRAIDSREELLARVTRFEAVYNLADAAKLLSVSEGTLRGFMDSGHLGWVELPTRVGMVGRRITGWQIIDFLEFWEQAQKANPHSPDREALVRNGFTGSRQAACDE